ncbi:hypothetical protein TIFTF001_002424 [Ficus carica]|uniref:Uncharacterized protein n=1 Tax=Ficus carica TaxID=3494 RepID=A0AA87ZD36_FICCA|nr:hypothetical protein TIFTF001_002424 [Ficus carica]
MAEKSSAYTTTYNRFTSLAKLSVRFLELCVALALLAWIFARIPLAVEISGDCFRQFSGVFSNPLFVFFLCHVILVSLMANSGQFSGWGRTIAGDANAELYDAVVNCEDETRIVSDAAENDVASRETEEIVYEDKQVVSEENMTAITGGETPEASAESGPDSDCPRVLYRRWQSENFERESADDNSETLRRSESDKCLDIVVSGKEEINPITGDSHPHDELSDEDFNRTVEAFIAKQLKFRRQEDVYDAVSLSCGGIKSYELTKAKLHYQR